MTTQPETQPFRAEFDLDPSVLYLNSGSLSISPREVFEAAEGYRRRYEKDPTSELFDTWPRLWAVQKELAGFLGADPREVFLRHNVTGAMNAFLLGMPIERARGGEFLVTELEYGAVVNICRLRAEREGMSVRVAPLPVTAAEMAGATPASVVEALVRELRPETRVLLVSHVMTFNGLVLPLRELARETRKRGVLLAVDGAHAPGAVPVEFRELEDVDFYGGNLHKWVMAPKGTGFGWLPRRHHERLQVIEGGWTTYEIPPAFRPFGDGDAFAARMLMANCHDFSSLFAIPETVAFWRRLGFDRILARRKALRDRLEREMAERAGWTLVSPPEGPLRGPLLTWELPERLQAGGHLLRERLRREHRMAGIQVQARGRWHVRLSPALHNSEEEMARAAGILAAL